MQRVGAPAMEVVVKQSETGNISAQGYGLQSAEEVIPYEISNLILDMVETRKTCLSCTTPDMAAILHLMSNLTLIEIKHRFRSLTYLHER